MTYGERARHLRAEIAGACGKAGRNPGDVDVLAVSKTRSAEQVRFAYGEGQRMFGENRLQELVEKAATVGELPGLTWHFIGSVQTNKVAALLAVPSLTLIHSLDRVRLAEAIEFHAHKRGRVVDTLIQVDDTGDDNKHGARLDEVPALLDYILERCPHVVVHGLMAMGPREGDPRPVFDRVAAMLQHLGETTGLPLPILSLGMSGDLTSAIEAGSTLLRVGTALFGPRQP